MAPESAAQVAERLAGAYGRFPEIEAVALAGSRAAGVCDAGSDLDLYVYARTAVPLEARAEVARGSAGAGTPELDNRFFEPGDEWTDAATALPVDVMFRGTGWIEDRLDAVLVRHEAAVGYSTALWHSVRAARPLFDRTGWFAALQRRASSPYPEPLVQAVVARNRPLLRERRSSFLVQLRRAIARGDAVSANHRAAAFLASLFDVLFAVNRVPHPGEKRLLALAERLCPRRPPALALDVRALVAGAGAVDREAAAAAERLADGIDALLRSEGLLA